MSIKTRFVKFATGLFKHEATVGIVTGKRITADMVKYLSELSNFGGMPDDEIYEQFYVWEPEIGSGIDRISTLVSQSFKSFIIEAGQELSPEEKECARIANQIADEISIAELMESWTETLMTHGNVFIYEPDGITIQVLPNKYVTIIDKLGRESKVGSTIDADTIITDANYLLLYESNPNVTNKTYNYKTDIKHIKYKLTNVFQKDHLNRTTFGLYSISPLHRTILPVWWKRQSMIIDIMWRWRNVPREHHKLESSMFSLDRYTGTKAEKTASAKADADAAISSYIDKMTKQEPDQGYVTLDNTEIGIIESKTSHIQTNELTDQLDSKIWTALNVPESIVSGKSSGSYASELVISSYVTSKVIKLAKKFKPILLDIVTKRIKQIDPSLPYNKLNVKFELVMATSKLEMYRQAAIMASIGMFTDTEIRDMLSYDELTDDQRNNIMEYVQVLTNARSGTTLNDVMRDTMREEPGNPPQSPQSDIQHPSDASDSAIKTSEV